MRAAALLGAGALALLACVLAVPAHAFDQQVSRGRTLARAECARCHAVERMGTSPLPQAPPFRTLHERYPVEELAEALTEGIRTGHPTMPEFRFDPDEAMALIAYMRSMER